MSNNVANFVVNVSPGVPDYSPSTAAKCVAAAALVLLANKKKFTDIEIWPTDTCLKSRPMWTDFGCLRGVGERLMSSAHGKRLESEIKAITHRIIFPNASKHAPVDLPVGIESLAADLAFKKQMTSREVRALLRKRKPVSVAS